MPIADIVNGIYKIAKTIQQQAELVKANQAQCQRLAQRVGIVISAIRGLQNVDSKTQYEAPLNSLQRCLRQCSTFIESFTVEKKWFKQILKAGAAQAKFRQLNDELQRSVNLLELGLVAQQISNHEQDQQDHARDIANIAKQQQEIIRLNKEFHEKAQQWQNQNANHQGVVLQQLNSIKARLNELTTTKNVSKPSIAEHLLIPFYELAFVKQITNGFIGPIYQGRWSEQDVVIKTCQLNSNTEERDYFIRQMQVISQLRHTNIVRFFGACTESSRECMIMEFLPNGSLDQHLKKRKFSPAQKHQIATDIVTGLAYLHQRDILHRALHGSNVLLTRNFNAKLSGFSLAKVKSRHIKTAKLKTKGFVEYQAPECLQFNSSYSKASDCYSLGMLLWELWTEQLPYAYCEGKQRDQQIITAVLSNKREKLPDTIPDDYKQIIQQCWQHDPIKRPKVTEILNQLKKLTLQDSKLTKESVEEKKSENQPVKPPQTQSTFFKNLPDTNQQSGEIEYKQGIEFEKQKQFEKAYQQYQLAAQKGHSKAITNIGFFCLKGLGGTQKDKKQAYQYFLQAAQKGHSRAMFNVAMMLEKGDGIDKNLTQALKWYDKAAKEGNQKAKQKAKILRQQLSEYSYQNNMNSSS